MIEAAARGEVLEDLLWRDPKTRKRIEKQRDIPFFQSQKRTTSRATSKKVDPIRIYDHIENGGYYAFARVLERGGPHRVVDEVKASGLRGRGGAGTRTSTSWERLWELLPEPLPAHVVSGGEVLNHLGLRAPAPTRPRTGWWCGPLHRVRGLAAEHRVLDRPRQAAKNDRPPHRSHVQSGTDWRWGRPSFCVAFQAAMIYQCL